MKAKLNRTHWAGSWECKNLSNKDFEICHMYRLDDGQYGICYDHSMTKKVFPNFKTAREYVLAICSPAE